MKAWISGAVLTVTVIGALTACGPKSEAPGAAAAAGDTSAAATSPAAGTAGTGAAAARAVSVCAVLSVPQAARLSGQPYTSGVSETGDWASRCAYNNDDSTAEGADVTIFTGETANTWNLVHTRSFTDIGGLGDKAFWDNDNTLYVMSGALLIQVNGLDSKDRSVALARPVLAALH